MTTQPPPESAGQCSRCKLAYIDGRVCSASGFTLLCNDPHPESAEPARCQWHSSGACSRCGRAMGRSENGVRECAEIAELMCELSRKLQAELEIAWSDERDPLAKETEELRAALQGKDDAIAELQAKLEDVRILQQQLEEEGGQRNGSQRVWSIAGDISSILRGDDAWKNRDPTAEAAEFAAASRESHPPVAETQVIAELMCELSRKLQALTEDRRVQRVRAADAEIALTEERSLTAELRRKLEAEEREFRDFVQEFARYLSNGERDNEAYALREKYAAHVQAKRQAPPAQPPPAKPLTPDDVRTIAREVIAEVAGRAQRRLAHDEPALLELAEAAKEES